MKKKIGIDAHSIGLQQGGNERYAEGLLKGISEVETKDFTFTVFFNNRTQIPGFLKENPSFEFETVSTSSLKRFLFELPLKVKKTKVDILHTQYHIPLFTNVPSIITFHDVSYLTHPEFFPYFEKIKMSFFMPYSVKKAKKIISVSEFSKKEIKRIYGIPENRICSIYNGISDEFKIISENDIQKTLKKYKIFTPYILTVSNIQPRKNLKGLVKSFFRILKENKNFPCNLVIVGKKLWLYDEIFSEIRNSEFKEKVIFTDYIDNSDLIGLYNGAKMFVYVSFYEGFGFPVLEAMACGCPVITSNVSSLPEIVGNAAIMVNPSNIDEISQAMITLYYDNSLQKRLKEKGYLQAKKFSWKECAQKTLEVYKEVLSLI